MEKVTTNLFNWTLTDAIFVLVCVFFCAVSTGCDEPSRIRCIEGVKYYRSLSNGVMTLLVDKNNKPIECK